MNKVPQQSSHFYPAYTLIFLEYIYLIYPTVRASTVLLVLICFAIVWHTSSLSKHYVDVNVFSSRSKDCNWRPVEGWHCSPRQDTSVLWAQIRHHRSRRLEYLERQRQQRLIQEEEENTAREERRSISRKHTFDIWSDRDNDDSYKKKHTFDIWSDRDNDDSYKKKKATQQEMNDESLVASTHLTGAIIDDRGVLLLLIMDRLESATITKQISKDDTHIPPISLSQTFYIIISGVLDSTAFGAPLTGSENPVEDPIDTPLLALPPLCVWIFGANDGPLAGKEETKIASSKIRDRLIAETDNNVTLKVEASTTYSEKTVVYVRG
jgi:hypothetical protein